MTFRALFLAVLMLLTAGTEVCAAPWTEDNSRWNMNLSPDGSRPARYFGEWPGHSYFPSPEDWRDVPVYHVMLDRFSDGDPRNNDGKFGGYNLYDPTMRQGGDLLGLTNKLDYIKGLGFKAIWISAVFQNAHNDYHGYGPIDYTLIDDRLGTLRDMRELTSQAHKRGLYVIVDVVVNHLNNFFHTKGNRDKPAPFRFHDAEYELEWYDETKQYADFHIVNDFSPEGKYCSIYNNQGLIVDDPGEGSFWESDFHHNGDLSDWTDPWSRHLGEVYGFLDDLRTTHPRVQNKIIAMTRAMIASTDIDGIRMDSPMLVPLCFFKHWAPSIRQFAASIGKTNFAVFGEFYNTYEVAATMIGRGKSANQYGTDSVIDERYVMDGGINYRLYHQFFLPNLYHDLDGYMDGALKQLNWGLANFDLLHPGSGEKRYRMWNFYNNHDQRRLCITDNGSEKNRLAAFFISVWPGIPLFYFGDEQGLCSYGTALEGHSRESFMTSIAWKQHPSPLPENPASADNFNMVHPDYLFVQRLMELRELYPALRKTNTITQRYVRKDSKRGIYAFSRETKSDSAVLVVLNTAESGQALAKEEAIPTPWSKGTKIRNTLQPSETYVLGDHGRLTGITVDSFEGKLFVPASQFKRLSPHVIKVRPEHDAAISSDQIKVELEFDVQMDAGSIKRSLSVAGKKVKDSDFRAEPGGRSFAAAFRGLPPGIHYITLDEDVRSVDGRKLRSKFLSRFRLGDADNVLVNSGARKSSEMINKGQTMTKTELVKVNHKAQGAQYFRISNDGGYTWGPWKDYQTTSEWSLGRHNGFRRIVVQYWSDGSSAYFAEDWIDRYRYDGFPMK